MSDEASIQEGVLLTPEEKQRLVSFFSVLIEIDRHNKAQQAKKSRNEETVDSNKLQRL